MNKWLVALIAISLFLVTVSLFSGSAGSKEVTPGVNNTPEHGELISLRRTQLIWQEIIKSPAPLVTKGDVELWNEMDKCSMRFDESLELLEKEAGVQYAGRFSDDSSRGIIYIGLVKPTREQMESIIDAMKPSPRVKVVFYEAQFTLSQLEEAADRISARFDELCQAGVLIQMLDACEVKNKLVVGLRELKEEYKTMIRQIVGEDIPIEFEKVGKWMLVSKTARYHPVFGGIQVTTPVGRSTLSFAASRGGVSGFVMTGHAGDVGTNVFQPTMLPITWLGQ